MWFLSVCLSDEENLNNARGDPTYRNPFKYISKLRFEVKIDEKLISTRVI